MARLFTIPRIAIIANILIAVVVAAGAMQIGRKAHQLVFAPDEIDIVRLEVPWFHNRDNVSILLEQDILAGNAELYQKVQSGVLAYDLVERIVYIVLFVLALILLKRLIISINARTFFSLQNISIIHHLALVVLLFVVAKFVLYQLIPVAVPVELMVERVNFSPLDESVVGNMMAATDFRMLFAALVLYVVAVSFREGYELKKESELTI